MFSFDLKKKKNVGREEGKGEEEGSRGESSSTFWKSSSRFASRSAVQGLAKASLPEVCPGETLLLRGADLAEWQRSPLPRRFVRAAAGPSAPGSAPRDATLPRPSHATLPAPPLWTFGKQPLTPGARALTAPGSA